MERVAPIPADGDVFSPTFEKSRENYGVPFGGNSAGEAIVGSGVERNSVREEAFFPALKAHAVPASSASSRYRYVSVWSGPSKVTWPFSVTVL